MAHYHFHFPDPKSGARPTSRTTPLPGNRTLALNQLPRHLRCSPPICKNLRHCKFLLLVFHDQFDQVKHHMWVRAPTVLQNADLRGVLATSALQVIVSRNSAIAAAVADVPAEDPVLLEGLHRTVRVSLMFLRLPILILRIRCFHRFATIWRKPAACASSCACSSVTVSPEASVCTTTIFTIFPAHHC